MADGNEDDGLLALFAGLAITAASWGAAGPAAAGWIYAFTAGLQVTNYALQRDAQRKAREQANLAISDRMLTIKSTDAPRTIVYGRARVSGPVNGGWTFGDKGQSLTFTLPLAGHEIDAVEAIYLDEHLVGTLDADGWVTEGSRFYRTIDKRQTFEADWPGVGGTITVPDALHIESVAIVGGDPQIALVEGLDYAVSYSAGTAYVTPGRDAAVLRDQVSATGGDPNDEFPGAPASVDLTTRRVVITYRYQEVMKNVRIKVFLGDPAGARDTNLEADSGYEWAATDLGKEVPRLHVTLVYNDELFGSTGLPNVSAVIRGKKVYNPVTDTTAWSDNAALCVLDYLLDDYGFRADYTEVDDTLAQLAANICAQSVPTDSGSGTQHRYTVNGVLYSDADRRSNLADLVRCMGGMVAWSGGKWLIRAGAYVSPTYTLTDDDLAGGMTVAPLTPRRDLFNSVRGRFVDPTQGWQTIDYPPYSSSTYIAEDGDEEVVREIDFPLVTDSFRAQRLAKLELYRARQALVFEATWNLSAYPLQPGDTVYVKLERYGWSGLNGGAGKIFRVISRSLGMDKRIKLSLQEEASAVYAWDYSEATDPDPSPNSTLPDYAVVNPLAGFRVFSNEATFRVLPDGTIVRYARVSWDAVEDDGVLQGGAILLYYKRAHQAAYEPRTVAPTETYYDIEDVSPGEVLNVYAVVRNAKGTKSDPIGLSHRADWGLPVPAPVSVSGNLLSNASFAHGSEGWELIPNGVPSVTYLGKDDAALIMPGSPSNVILWQWGTESGIAPYARSTPFPVRPLRRYAFFASVCPAWCRGFVGIAFFDASGAYIDDSVVYSDQIEAGVYAPNVLAAHTRTGKITTAPALAATARLNLYKSGTAVGGPYSGVSVVKPFAGEMDSTANALPAWDAGQTGPIVTAAIAPWQTVDTYSYNQPTGRIAVSSVTPYALESPTFTPGGDWRAVLTASGVLEVTHANNPSPPIKQFAGHELQVSVDGGAWGYPGDGTSSGKLSDCTRGWTDTIGEQLTFGNSIPKCVHQMVKGRTYRFRVVAYASRNFTVVAEHTVLGVEIQKV